MCLPSFVRLGSSSFLLSSPVPTGPWLSHPARNSKLVSPLFRRRLCISTTPCTRGAGSRLPFPRINFVKIIPIETWGEAFHLFHSAQSEDSLLHHTWGGLRSLSGVEFGAPFDLEALTGPHPGSWPGAPWAVDDEIFPVAALRRSASGPPSPIVS